MQFFGNIKFNKFFYSIILFIFILFVNSYASSKKLCEGEQFNKRIKNFLNEDTNATGDYSITIFERGFNPPDDRAYYVDISEDEDGSVIAYKNGNTLYWYSISNAVFNSTASHMFDGFYKIRNIDFTEFAFLDDLHDTRYMFSNCRNLRNLKWRTNSGAKNNSSYFNIVEMQGMFFNCQSLQSIDLSYFNISRVFNINEVFCGCYNVRNIYINKDIWNLSNVNTATGLFRNCQVLRTNFGRKAIDMNDSSYLSYAIAGEENKEGLLKDINTTYADYGESYGTVPIDGLNYITETAETTITFAEEPQSDGDMEKGDAYLGDKNSGYYAEKEGQSANSIITPSGVLNPITAESYNSIFDPNYIDEQPSTGWAMQTETTKNESSINITPNTNETLSPTITESETIIENTETNISESIIENEANTSETNIENEMSDGEMTGHDGNGKRIIEIGDNYGKNKNEETDYKFYIFALLISITAILLLIGVIIFLVQDKKNDKNNNKL